MQLGYEASAQFGEKKLREEFVWRPGKVARIIDGVPDSVSAGGAHNAAVTWHGSVYTWGGGEVQIGQMAVHGRLTAVQFGRLGHGFARPEPTPRLVSALLSIPVQQVACGCAHRLGRIRLG
jgi:alpha-tubulin suppressor-like RCC1 family protein